jgi:hypothetical protein
MRRFLAFTPTLYLEFEPITKAGPRHALCGVAYLLVMAPMAFSQDVTEHSVLYYDPPSVPNPVSTLGPHIKIGLGGTQPHWQRDRMKVILLEISADLENDFPFLLRPGRAFVVFRRSYVLLLWRQQTHHEGYLATELLDSRCA